MSHVEKIKPVLKLEKKCVFCYVEGTSKVIRSLTVTFNSLCSIWRLCFLWAKLKTVKKSFVFLLLFFRFC